MHPLPSTRASRPWWVAALALAVLVGAGVVHAAQRRGGPSHRLSVATLRQPATSLVFVAQAAGCFERERLELDERTFDLGRDALVALLAGETDVAIAYETPILYGYAADDRLRVLTAIHTSTRNTRAVARRDLGVAQITDLRGKRLGAARGTNADFFVDHLLAFAGLARAEVTIVDVPPARAAAAISAGEVDAVALSDPYAAHVSEALGERAVEFVTDLYPEFSMAATRTDVVAARRPALLAFLRALACGERFLGEHPAEADAAVRARFPEQSEAAVRGALARVRRGIGLDESLRAVLRREAEWMTSAGASVRDLDRLVDASLLDEVEPEAMNLVTQR